MDRVLSENLILERKKKLNDDIIERIEEYFEDSQYSQIKNNLQLEISTSCLNRILNQQDIIYQPLIQKLLLINDHITQRIEFWKQYKYQNWENVLFCDETCFYTHSFKSKV
ncbi:hypothetical protein ABPG72_012205 [Tetrahymena utriculariae]